MRIALIGGGFMGEALVGAVLKDGLASADQISVAELVEVRRRYLAERYGVAVSEGGAQAAGGAEMVVLAVKPQEFAAAATNLGEALSPGQTVVSIMAGVGLERIREALGHEAIVRVMPNTAASVGQAMSVWYASDAVTAEGRESVRRLLRALGREVELPDEKYIDMATAVSGSGPAFVFLFIEALVDGAVHVGLRRELAQEMVLQTVLGAVCLARETGKHPAELRNMITSPGGTTTAGLQALENAGMRAAVIGAVEAAYERTLELGG